jgi:plastocyanin
MIWVRCVFVLLIASAQFLPASDIEGTVIITRRLSKKKVTAPASSYSRGVAVELKHDTGEEILELERSRVVIYLEGNLPARPATGEIVQISRQFVPDTVVVPAGSTVRFPNQDPIFHNVFSLSKPKSFDLGNYSRNQTRTETFPKPGIVLVHCHLHPNMAAAILVAPNGFTAIADKSGKFTIHDVPPGDYTAIAWHRSAGYFRRPVKVTADHGDHLQFLIPLEGSTSEKVLAQR